MSRNEHLRNIDVGENPSLYATLGEYQILAPAEQLERNSQAIGELFQELQELKDTGKIKEEEFQKAVQYIEGLLFDDLDLSPQDEAKLKLINEQIEMIDAGEQKGFRLRTYGFEISKEDLGIINEIATDDFKFPEDLDERQKGIVEEFQLGKEIVEEIEGDLFEQIEMIKSNQRPTHEGVKMFIDLKRDLIRKLYTELDNLYRECLARVMNPDYLYNFENLEDKKGTNIAIFKLLRMRQWGKYIFSRNTNSNDAYRKLGDEYELFGFKSTVFIQALKSEYPPKLELEKYLENLKSENIKFKNLPSDFMSLIDETSSLKLEDKISTFETIHEAIPYQHIKEYFINSIQENNDGKELKEFVAFFQNILYLSKVNETFGTYIIYELFKKMFFEILNSFGSDIDKKNFIIQMIYQIEIEDDSGIELLETLYKEGKKYSIIKQESQEKGEFTFYSNISNISVYVHSGSKTIIRNTEDEIQFLLPKSTEDIKATIHSTFTSYYGIDENHLLAIQLYPKVDNLIKGEVITFRIPRYEIVINDEISEPSIISDNDIPHFKRIEIPKDYSQEKFDNFITTQNNIRADIRSGLKDGYTQSFEKKKIKENYIYTSTETQGVIDGVLGTRYDLMLDFNKHHPENIGQLRESFTYVWLALNGILYGDFNSYIQDGEKKSFENIDWVKSFFEDENKIGIVIEVLENWEGDLFSDLDMLSFLNSWVNLSRYMPQKIQELPLQILLQKGGAYMITRENVKNAASLLGSARAIGGELYGTIFDKMIIDTTNYYIENLNQAKSKDIFLVFSNLFQNAERSQKSRMKGFTTAYQLTNPEFLVNARRNNIHDFDHKWMRNFGITQLHSIDGISIMHDLFDGLYYEWKNKLSEIYYSQEKRDVLLQDLSETETQKMGAMFLFFGFDLGIPLKADSGFWDDLGDLGQVLMSGETSGIIDTLINKIENQMGIESGIDIDEITTEVQENYLKGGYSKTDILADGNKIGHFYVLPNNGKLKFEMLGTNSESMDKRWTHENVLEKRPTTIIETIGVFSDNNSRGPAYSMGITTEDGNQEILSSFVPRNKGDGFVIIGDNFSDLQIVHRDEIAGNPSQKQQFFTDFKSGKIQNFAQVPLLVHNGKNITGTNGINRNKRRILGQKENGEIIIMKIKEPVTLYEVAEISRKFGFVSAVNLDRIGGIQDYHLRSNGEAVEEDMANTLNTASRFVVYE